MAFMCYYSVDSVLSKKALKRALLSDAESILKYTYIL